MIVFDGVVARSAPAYHAALRGLEDGALTDTTTQTSSRAGPSETPSLIPPGPQAFTGPNGKGPLTTAVLTSCRLPLGPARCGADVLPAVECELRTKKSARQGRI